jgi:hypothetical protein
MRRTPLVRVLVDERLQQLGDLAASLPPRSEHDRLAVCQVAAPRPSRRVGCMGVGSAPAGPAVTRGRGRAGAS